MNQAVATLATQNQYSPTAHTQYIPQTQTSPYTQAITSNTAAYYPVVQSLYTDSSRQPQQGNSLNLVDSYKLNSAKTSQNYCPHHGSHSDPYGGQEETRN